jgi:hypothetical protein
MPTSVAFDSCRTVVRQLSDSYPTTVRQLSDNCQTQKEAGIPVKNTVVKLNLSGNIPENLLHDRDSMIPVKSGVLKLRTI